LMPLFEICTKYYRLTNLKGSRDDPFFSEIYVGNNRIVI